MHLTISILFRGGQHMKFGLHNTSFLANSGNIRDMWPELRDRAQWLETNGFDYLTVMDHVWQIPSVGNVDEPFMESWVTLGALAASTQHLQIGTLVTGVGYRNPALLAKMMSTLDLIAGGRAFLGIGGGWNEPEFDAYGYAGSEQFPRPGIRLAKLREAIRVAKLMWSEPLPTFRGKHIIVKEAILEPKPSPRPRILVGGGGEKVTLRIVAEEADMCNMLVAGPGPLARKLSILRQHCQAVGRDFGEIEVTVGDRLVLSETTEQANAKWQMYGARARDGYRGLTGSPDDIIRILKGYEDAGAHTMLLMVPNADVESRELFAKEVIPAFAP